MQKGKRGGGPEAKKHMCFRQSAPGYKNTFKAFECRRVLADVLRFRWTKLLAIYQISTEPLRTSASSTSIGYHNPESPFARQRLGPIVNYNHLGRGRTRRRSTFSRVASNNTAAAEGARSLPHEHTYRTPHENEMKCRGGREGGREGGRHTTSFLLPFL